MKSESKGLGEDKCVFGPLCVLQQANGTLEPSPLAASLLCGHYPSSPQHETQDQPEGLNLCSIVLSVKNIIDDHLGLVASGGTRTLV